MIRTYCCTVGGSGISNSRLANPMMLFIGVRISWLIIARNSIRALLLASAVSRAAARAASVRLRSVMSV